MGAIYHGCSDDKMKKKTLAWAVKFFSGDYKTHTQWKKKDAMENHRSELGDKIVRVEIREVKK